MLLRPYGIEGQVVSGRGVGSKQTVPTLNLATTAEVIPAAASTSRARAISKTAREWHSITNIGYRPTFGASDQLTIETFLLDPLEGETPARIRVEFLRRVRDERKFDTPESPPRADPQGRARGAELFPARQGLDGTRMHFLLSALSIVLIDLLLAGDNALVIALAVRSLPQRERRIGIIGGAGAAVRAARRAHRGRGAPAHHPLPANRRRAGHPVDRR